MSTRRAMPGASYTNLKRDETGHALCRWCERPVPTGRRTFCSKGCVHEWSLRTDPGYARRQVHLRDRGVCGVCGVDTDCLKRIADHLWSIGYTVDWRHHNNVRPSVERRREQFDIMLAILGVWAGHSMRVSAWNGNNRLYHHLWEADHIVPVVEGGGECGLEGLRTLCLRCHRDATRALAKRRAMARNPQQRLPLPEPK